MDIERRLAIAKAIRETKDRRKHQICKTYEVKIDKSHLNKKTLHALRMMFLEAKWLYNYVITTDPFKIDKKIKSVPVKVGDVFQNRDLRYLGSQIKEEIIDQIKDSIVSLSRLKKKGHKIGKLKFKNKIKTLPLRQYRKTYKIFNDNYLGIQKIKQKIKVSGLEQILDGVEITYGNLINKRGDYYLKITTFKNKENITPANTSIGIDFGLNKQLTFSNGIAVSYRINIPQKLRTLHKRLSKTNLGSKNRLKIGHKIQKEFECLNNIKKDIRNKIVSYLKTHYDIVCFQKENIKAWQRIWGSKMADTSIGEIIGNLKKRISIPIEVGRFFPSTKLCSFCGNKKDAVKLNERTYVCFSCGAVIDRDLNSAINIKNEGLKQLPAEHRNVKLVETKPSTLAMLEYLNSIPHVSARLVNETRSLTLRGSPYIYLEDCCW